MSGPPECERTRSTRQPPRQALLDLLGTGSVTPDIGESDWPAVLEAAGAHLLPTVALAAQRRGLASPVAVEERLAGALRANRALQLRRRAALKPALAALDVAGIPFIALKGLALAHLVYPDPGARFMSDVDLWVRPSSVDAAKAALAPLGWHQPWWRRKEDAAANQVCLQHRATPVLVELHHPPQTIAALAAGVDEQFWASRVRVDLGWTELAVLSPPDALLHLALHLAEHDRFINAVRPLLDVTRLLEVHPIAWDDLADRSRALGIRGWIAVTLGTARRMFGAPVPDDALRRFAVPDLDHLCAWAEEQAWRRPRPGEERLSILSAAGPGSRFRRLVARTAELVRPGSRSPRQYLHDARRRVRDSVPGLLRTWWTDVTRPGDGERRRQLWARNDELRAAMRRSGDRESLRDGAADALDVGARHV